MRIPKVILLGGIPARRGLSRYRVLMAMFVAAACMMVLARTAEARPGTPNNVIVRPCGDIRINLPRVCVSFVDTASELVYFQVEWTKDGQLQDSHFSGQTLMCMDSLGYVGAYDCGAKPMFGCRSNCGLGANIHESPRPQGFAVLDLAYNSVYCFRFRAVDSDDMVSEQWSSNECATMQAPVALPGLPPRPKLVYHPGVVINGKVDTPFRIDVDSGFWNDPLAADYCVTTEGGVKSACGVVWSAVTGNYNTLHNPWEDTTWTNTGFTYTVSGGNTPFDPGGNYSFQVCARNLSGATCSQAVRLATTMTTPGQASATNVLVPAKPVAVTIPGQGSTTNVLVPEKPKDVVVGAADRRIAEQAARDDAETATAERLNRLHVGPNGAASNPAGVAVDRNAIGVAGGPSNQPSSTSQGSSNPGNPGGVPIDKRIALANPAPSFSGRWEAKNSRGTHSLMILSQQENNSLTGSYLPGGRMSGTVKGNLLTFTWTETNNGKTLNGNGTLSLAADGKSFSGNWKASQGSDQGTWTGTAAP